MQSFSAGASFLGVDSFIIPPNCGMCNRKLKIRQENVKGLTRQRVKSAAHPLRGGRPKSIISRAPFGHTPNGKGSEMLSLLAPYMPPLRIAMKGLHLRSISNEEGARGCDPQTPWLFCFTLILFTDQIKQSRKLLLNGVFSGVLGPLNPVRHRRTSAYSCFPTFRPPDPFSASRLTSPLILPP